MDQAMYRRRIETEIECCRACWCADADEGVRINFSWQVCCGQSSLQFLQSRLHSTRLTRAGGTEEQQAHGFGLRTLAHALDDMLGVVQHHGDEELLVVISEGVAR